MKISFLIIFVFLIGCSGDLSDRVKEAEKSFAEKNYIDAVDSINLGLTRSKEPDDKELTGRAYELLGRSYHELNKIGKAAEAYEEALKRSDNVYEAAYNLGLIYLTERQPKKAVVAFERALRIRKNDPAALLGLGNAHFAARNYRAAKNAYDNVLDSSPGVRDALKFLAITNQRIRASRRRRR